MKKFVVQITNWEIYSLELLYFDSLEEANSIALFKWLRMPYKERQNTTIETGVITPELCLLDSRCEDEEWYETFFTTYHSSPEYLKLGNH